jgi:hypothetical protein
MSGNNCKRFQGNRFTIPVIAHILTYIPNLENL